MTVTMKPAGFWIRALAALLDGILLTAVAYAAEFAVLGAMYLFRVWVLGGTAELPLSESFSAVFVQVVNAIIYALLALVYYTYGHLRWGTTLAKRPLGIKVVNEKGGPITLKQSLLRNLGYVLSYLPFGAGFLMAALNAEKRALHELVSGTRSVRATF
ncbi:MAG: RDD family protein [Bdellovibrionales bacterium]|nr:RDD family protein [Bdellovibrionales bacterium]